MPMKWPTLPVIVTKAISFVLFLGTVILKYWDILKLYGQFGSHCIAGWEITDQVSKHLLLVFMSLIPDMAFVVGIAIAMALKSCNYGTDPGAIVYNIVTGLCCFWSIFYITAIEDCGNDAIAMVKSVTWLSLMAGILHLVNAVVCLIFLDPEERKLQARRPRNSET